MRLLLSYTAVWCGSTTFLRTVAGFAPNPPHRPSITTTTRLHAKKPQRLPANVEGPLYVNDKCINCAACHNFAPQSFDRHHPTDRYHYVYEQPATPTALAQARAAMAACPVAAIRLETKAERQHGADSIVAWTDEDQTVVDGVSGRTATTPPFPRQFLDSIEDVYWVGHHTEKSFGAVPYLLHTETHGWILIDTPRFGKPAQTSIESLTGPQGPNYLVLTHVDDTADHQRWAEHYYPNLQRIFHAHDLGPNNWLGDTTLEDVEILVGTDEPQAVPNEQLESLTMYDLQGQRIDSTAMDQHEVLLLHTPGHSPGSMTLWRRSTTTTKPGILFTGDTYGWTTRNGGRMTGFGRYGNNLRLQSQVLGALLALEDGWSVVAPGHGIPRDYRGLDPAVRSDELAVAQEDLLAYA